MLFIVGWISTVTTSHHCIYLRLRLCRRSDSSFTDITEITKLKRNKTSRRNAQKYRKLFLFRFFLFVYYYYEPHSPHQKKILSNSRVPMCSLELCVCMYWRSRGKKTENHLFLAVYSLWIYMRRMEFFPIY